MEEKGAQILDVSTHGVTKHCKFIESYWFVCSCQRVLKGEWMLNNHRMHMFVDAAVRNWFFTRNSSFGHWFVQLLILTLLWQLTMGKICGHECNDFCYISVSNQKKHICNMCWPAKKTYYLTKKMQLCPKTAKQIEFGRIYWTKKNPPMLQLKRKNWNLQWFLVSFLDRKTLLEYWSIIHLCTHAMTNASLDKGFTSHARHANALYHAKYWVWICSNAFNPRKHMVYLSPFVAIDPLQL